MADFGLTEDMYGTNYFRRRKSETGSEEKVPIKWMAPESIKNGIYTEASDVVSVYNEWFGSISCKQTLSPSVVIWSDCVGDLHLWEGTILWSSSHESPEDTAKRRETGET